MLLVASPSPPVLLLCAKYLFFPADGGSTMSEWDLSHPELSATPARENLVRGLAGRADSPWPCEGAVFRLINLIDLVTLSRQDHAVLGGELCRHLCHRV